MKKFIDFLKEEEVLDVPFKVSPDNIDSLNAELEAMTEKQYQNAPIFLAQLRGAFERYGILLPASMTKEFLNLDAEVVYALPNNDNQYVYAVYNTNDNGLVDGYAQIVSEDELNDLMGMSVDELLSSDDNEAAIKPRYLPARRDDDSGNSNEY